MTADAVADSGDVRVAPLARAQGRRAARVLAQALLDDPGWQHVVPRAPARRRALTTLTGIAVRDALVAGRPLAALAGDRLVGVAVWMPPGSYPPPRARRLRAVPALTALALRLPLRIGPLARLGAGVDAAFPAEPVWYLQALGVHPSAQGRGVGRRLLEPVLEQAGRDGVACYLETGKPANVAYYERLGFAALGPAQPLNDGGPAMTRMRRLPPPSPTAGG